MSKYVLKKYLDKKNVTKFYCDEYRRLFHLECLGKLPFRYPFNQHLIPLFETKRERKKESRFVFTRDLPYWTYPPYCRYGYYCKKCPEISMLWKYGKIIEVQQLTLF